jgi:hypothetical protein
VYPLSTVLTTEKNSNGVGPTYFCSGSMISSSVEFRSFCSVQFR